MNPVDEINDQIARLETEREDTMLTEKANVLAKMKADSKLYGFKTRDLKGVLATHKFPRNRVHFCTKIKN